LGSLADEPVPQLEDRILKPEQVAVILGYSRRKVLRLYRQGTLPGAWKEGKEWRIFMSDVRAYAKNRSAGDIQSARPIARKKAKAGAK